MRRELKGSLTVTLALSMLLFLSFCLVLVEGTRMYFLKVQAAQAMDLAQFSVLSEFQQELFNDYSVFFLELDYEQGSEQIEILKDRIRHYLTVNAESLKTMDISTEKLRRATDGEGSVFFRQVVAGKSYESGYHLLESLLPGTETEQVPDLETMLENNENAAETLLGSYQDEEGNLLFDISIPSISFPTVKALTRAVFGDEDALSEKSVNLQERIGQRTLLNGSGTSEDASFVQMQLFHQYLFEHFQFYGSGEQKGSVLEYQMEYLICGKGLDRENLEEVMWRIFLLRAGGNYLFYHQDWDSMAKAGAQAAVIAGMIGNPELTTLVQEIILMKQAIEDGITETRSIFAGEKVPFYKEGVFSGVEFGYEEYLYLFLHLTDKKDKSYRCMDLIELEIRATSGYEKFSMDHCTDSFLVQWNYGFDSIFKSMGKTGGASYEQTVTAPFKYDI